MPDIVLKTDRLLLRPPIEADLEGWAAFDADPQATAFFGGPKGRAAAWEGMALVAGMWALRGYGLFSVIERETGDWIGRVGPWAPPEHLGTEVGWALSPRVWGRGYAVEAATAAIEWVFAAHGWGEVVHCIDHGNEASVAVARRLGSPLMRTAVRPDGTPTRIYGQSREAWAARR